MLQAADRKVGSSISIKAPLVFAKKGIRHLNFDDTPAKVRFESECVVVDMHCVSASEPPKRGKNDVKSTIFKFRTTFQLRDGRNMVGKLEAYVKMRTPLVASDSQTIKERFVVVEHVKRVSKTAPVPSSKKVLSSRGAGTSRSSNSSRGDAGSSSNLS